MRIASSDTSHHSPAGRPTARHRIGACHRLAGAWGRPGLMAVVGLATALALSAGDVAAQGIGPPEDEPGGGLAPPGERI